MQVKSVKGLLTFEKYTTVEIVRLTGIQIRKDQIKAKKQIKFMRSKTDKSIKKTSYAGKALMQFIKKNKFSVIFEHARNSVIK